ncbi:MAG: hypothetical protein AB1798_16130, partial [Spirochaetota bacterium]
NEYYAFEKKLPVLAVGRNFLVSHAEPQRLCTKDEVIEYQKNPAVIYALTWTADNAAEKGSVIQMLKHYLKPVELDNAVYFGGHRPVLGRYNLRADGRYVQLHNPARHIIAFIRPEEPIDLEKDIIELKPETHLL